MKLKWLNNWIRNGIPYIWVYDPNRGTTFQRHQLTIDKRYGDFFSIIIIVIYVLKKIRIGFGQAPSIIEKLIFFHKHFTRLLSIYMNFSIFFLIIKQKFNEIFCIDSNYFLFGVWLKRVISFYRIHFDDLIVLVKKI